MFVARTTGNSKSWQNEYVKVGQLVTGSVRFGLEELPFDASLGQRGNDVPGSVGRLVGCLVHGEFAPVIGDR